MEQGSNLTEREDEMTTTETTRLIQWLIDHGHTYQEACECIAFISGKVIEKPE